MISTSNFAKSGKHPDAVAISQGVPRFYRVRRYMPLAPPRWLLKAKDHELFDREYRKQLESLDAKQVAEDLGPNAIILCWESFNVRCHRRLVAEWLEEKLGVFVPELEHERAESLGSIVLVKGGSPHSDVVDGQQRLTTLTILLSVLRLFVTSDEAEDLTALLYEKSNPVLGTQDRYRVTLREQDAGFFREYIQNPEGIRKLRNLTAARLTDSQRNLRDNALMYCDALNNVAGPRRTRLAQFVALRCYLVVVTTPDLSSAYRIFAILNSRGLDLLPSDILKAEVIGEIVQANQKSYSEKWEDVEEALGRDSFQELFAHIRMINRKAKLKETLVEECEKYIEPNPKKEPTSFIDQVLVPMGDAYREIKTASFQATALASEVNGLLKWLNRIDNFDWVPPAVLYLSKHRNAPDKVLEFLRGLERLATGLMILRADVNERVNRFGSLLTSVEKNEGLNADNESLQLTSTEMQNILKTLDGDLYLEKKTRLLVLLRLDSELAKGQATYNYPTITVEHVLPQTPEPTSTWIKWFPTEELRETYTHRIGNLVLLARPKNSQAQNFDFDVKKKKYFTTSKGVSNFALTTQVLAETEWTPEVVVRRQKDALSLLKGAWRLS